MKQNDSFPFLLWLVVLIGVFSLILFLNNELYINLTQDDGIVEYLGFILFIAAGGFVLAAGVTGLIEKKKMVGGSILLILFGFLFFYTAFEEVSWGQRFLGFTSTEELLTPNDENVNSIYNIGYKFIDRFVIGFSILIAFFATVMLLLKKPRLWGIRLPNAYIILTFALIPFYQQYNQVHLEFYHLLYIPILVLMLRSFKGFNHKEFAANLLTILVSLLLLWVYTRHNHYFPTNCNCAKEIREFLFAFVCAYYAYFIFDDVKWDRVLLEF